ncbi:MAG: phenylalanine--tRNA ligase subunit alpha, partial [Dehalococcoidia bacterium]
MERLEELKTEAAQELEAISNLKELEPWQVRYLGRKSALTQLLRGLAALPLEERKAVGAAANQVKAALEAGWKRKEAALKEIELAGLLGAKPTDVTLPGRPVSLGR